MNPSKSTQPEALLVQFLKRSGYLRLPNEERRAKDDQKYKKGYEIRLVLNTQREPSREPVTVRRILRKVGIKPAKAFKKHNRWVQPIYGKKIIESFHRWLEEFS